MVAAAHALQILGYFELSEEDRPPERIWLNSEALSDFFDALRARHKAKSEGMEPVPEGGTELQNPVTAGWR